MKYSIILLIFLAIQFDAFTQIGIDPRIRSVAVLVQFSKVSGSGFYMQDSAHVYFVTAYHVIFNLQSNQPYEDTVSLISYRMDAENDPKILLRLALRSAAPGDIRMDPRNDLVAIKIANLQPYDTLGNYKINYLPYAQRIGQATYINSCPINLAFKFNEVIAGSEIFVIGYPKSLGLQGNFDLDRPLFRKGIIAGKDVSYHRIIGDAPVYFGNSGGIVLGMGVDATILKLVGLVSEYIPFNDLLFDSRGNLRSLDAKNSGYSVIIPADKILDLLKTF